MSIRAIRLRNFRGFSNITLDLKPLTVLLGPNSSGKSSFGHAIAAVAHCEKLYAGTQHPSLTPDGDSEEWPIDLGSVRDLRTLGRSGRVYVGIETENGPVDLGFGEFGESDREKNNLSLSYLSHPFGAAHGNVIPVNFDGEAVSGPALGLVRMNQGTWWDEIAQEQATVELDGLLMRSMRRLSTITSIPPAAAQEMLRFLLSTLTYLRANRKRPARGYEDKLGKWQRIGYGGEWTAALLQDKGGQQISFPYPPGIPTSVGEARNSLDQEWVQWTGTLMEGIAVWLERLGLARSVASIRSLNDKRRIELRVTLPEQAPHDITEIGFAVSQILPVLTAGLMQPRGSFFVVDLPEAHLHPWPQARLADFFCSLALSGRYALVETHSEMLFHRLRLWVALNRNLLDKVAVYFIDEPRVGECSPPRVIGLDSGEQIKWPVGFLGEAWDTEKRIQTVREVRSVRT